MATDKGNVEIPKITVQALDVGVPDPPKMTTQKRHSFSVDMGWFSKFSSLPSTVESAPDVDVDNVSQVSIDSTFDDFLAPMPDNTTRVLGRRVSAGDIHTKELQALQERQSSGQRSGSSGGLSSSIIGWLTTSRRGTIATEAIGEVSEDESDSEAPSSVLNKMKDTTDLVNVTRKLNTGGQITAAAEQILQQEKGKPSHRTAFRDLNAVAPSYW